MRNLFALIGILVVAVGGTGWYLGWYKVNVSKNPDGKLEIQTNVDTQKVSGDSSAFFQKVGQMVSEKSQPSGQNGNPAPATAPAATPANAPGANSTTPPVTATPPIPSSTSGSDLSFLPAIPPLPEKP